VKLRWWLLAFAGVPLVLSFVPGLPANGYGEIWYGLPLVLWFARPRQRRRLLLFALGWGLQVLAFPEPDHGYLGWVLLVPYLLARELDDGASWFRAAYLYGFLRAHAGFYWLGAIHYVAWLGVSLGSALVFAVCFEGFLRLLRSLPYALRVGTAWVLFEWVHSWFLGGFPWLFLAHTQYRYSIVIQSADVWGAYGVSFLIAFTQAAGLEAIRTRRAGVPLAAAGVLLLIDLGYGVVRSGPAGLEDRPGALLVQTAVPHSVKATTKDPHRRSKMFAQLIELTERGLAEHPETRLIVWPETMHPWDYVAKGGNDAFQEAARIVAHRFRLPAVYGATAADSPEDADAGRGWNAAILVDRDGAVKDVYGKQRLVPMGEEFLPRRWFPDAADRWYLWLVEHVGYPETCNLAPGDGFVALNAGEGVRCAPLICFEGLYAHLARGAVLADRPDLILHLVNNGWFGNTWAQRQCLASWVFRAVETRTPFLSCANAGITCAVRPDGTIGPLLDRVFESGSVYAPIPPRWPDPLFLRGGYLVVPVGLAVAAAFFWIRARFAGPGRPEYPPLDGVTDPLDSGEAIC